MKFFITTIVHLFCFNVLSQTITQYFLVSKSDTLIKKQFATKENKYQGYIIINENKIVKKITKSSKINGDDTMHNAFETLSFTFKMENDTIVDKSYIKKLNLIKDRKEFLKKNTELDETRKKFIFIEPIKCDKFILRKVRPIIFE